MISYTDFKDTAHWTSLLHEKGEYALEKAILKEVRKLFPSIKIPNPIFFKAHEWSDGCTYWLPGIYDPNELSEKMMKPFPSRFPNLYCCGESFSVGLQAWMEGALQNAESLVEKYL